MASDPDLAGIRVTVAYLGLDGAAGGGDDEVHLATTDSNGLYLVDELPGGNYTVTVNTAHLPSGMTASWDLDGTADDTWTGGLAEDEDKLDVDFAYTGTGSIGDNVFWEVDNSGGFGAGDTGVANVGITVTWFGFDDAAGGGDDVVHTTTTDANGDYLIVNLPAGEYTIVVNPATLPSGMVQTYDADGTGTSSASSYSLAAGEDSDAPDFGYTGAGSIGDLVWLDTNTDGSVTTGGPGIPVQLTWSGEDGVLGNADDHAFTTTTDSDGNYTFPNLPGDLYQVDVVGGLPLAATNTFDYDTDLDSSTPVNLGDGVDFEGADFGYDGDAFIGDTVWWDINDNGVVDAGEPGLGGVDVELTYAGPDGPVGSSDDLVFTTTTDSDGNYVFSDLSIGNYEVAVTGGVPTGFVPTYDEDCGDDETSVVSGLTNLEFHDTADFGYRGTGSIGDLIYLDSNASGVHDPGEPGLPGIDVELTWDGVDGVAGTSDDVTLTTTTDAVGDYSFDFLPAGDYGSVAVQTATLPVGLTLTGDPDGPGTPNVSSLALTPGEANDLQDFGYTGGAAVGDTVWFDRNDDGVFDADQYGLSGVDVWVVWAGPDGLLDTGDDEVFGDTADLDGEYLVTNLPPGEYRVWLDTATLPAGMAATFDEDGTLDDLTEFSLADLETDSRSSRQRCWALVCLIGWCPGRILRDAAQVPAGEVGGEGPPPPGPASGWPRPPKPGLPATRAAWDFCCAEDPGNGG